MYSVIHYRTIHDKFYMNHFGHPINHQVYLTPFRFILSISLFFTVKSSSFDLFIKQILISSRFYGEMTWHDAALWYESMSDIDVGKIYEIWDMIWCDISWRVELMYWLESKLEELMSELIREKMKDGWGVK